LATLTKLSRSSLVILDHARTEREWNSQGSVQ
jgi:hypothetical protein